MGDILRSLRQGKQRILKYGWVQQIYGDKACGYCVLGALDCTSSTDETASVFARANNIDLNEFTPIVDWNDHPSRTKRGVLGAFDRAIALAEKEGV